MPIVPPKTVAGIMRPLSKIVDQLDKHIAAQKLASERAKAKAEASIVEAQSAELEQDAARAARENIARLIGTPTGEASA